MVAASLSRNKTYISPSDNIMSPCTAKLSAFRSKQVGKYVEPPTVASYTRPKKEHRLTEHAPSRVKPKSLFAQASAKKLDAGGDSGSGSGGGGLFGGKPAHPPSGAN